LTSVGCVSIDNGPRKGQSQPELTTVAVTGTILALMNCVTTVIVRTTSADFPLATLPLT
jgi:hypothetical protein